MMVRQAVAGVALAAVLSVPAVALWQSSRDDAGDSAAFVDASATSQLVEQVTVAVGSAFSVDPRNVEATRRHADTVLTGEAVAQYDDLYGPALAAATQSRVSLSTDVRIVGVVWLRDSRAKLLVFADQSVRTPQGQSRTGPAQLVVLADRDVDAWKLADIRVR